VARRLAALFCLALLGSCSKSAEDAERSQQSSGGSGECVACDPTQTCVDGSCVEIGSSGGSSGAAGSGSATGGGTASSGGGETSGGASGSGSTTSSGGAGTGSGATNVCDTADEAATVTLTCPDGLVISDVVFASYGDPSGACGSFTTGECHAASSAPVVRARCAGKNSCTIQAGNAAFGDPCNAVVKTLAVEVSCAETAARGTLPFKGVANSPCNARKALDVSWYYNWEQNEKEPCDDGGGGEFVPMIWGHAGNEQTAQGITNAVSSFVAQGHDYVLGFNEPDNSTQANIPVGTAMTLLPAFDNPQIKIVSPATAANANPGQAWFSDFMELLEVSDARVDVMGIHWYGWSAGSCDASASQLETYINWVESLPGERPIWITEWGCLNQSAPDEQTVIDFYQGALAVFARHPRIERYAWYPWATNCGLNEEDGSLTALGEVYAAAHAYR
jgi:hypothetical protein